MLDQDRLAENTAPTLRGCSPYAALWKDYVRSMEGELVGAEA